MRVVFYFIQLSPSPVLVTVSGTKIMTMVILVRKKMIASRPQFFVAVVVDVWR
jgi:hypothetical protein